MPKTKPKPDLSPEAVRARLRELIAGSGLSIGATAARADMTISQLSNILTGRRGNPSVKSVGRILAAMSKTWRDLD